MRRRKKINVGSMAWEETKDRAKTMVFDELEKRHQKYLEDHPEELV